VQRFIDKGGGSWQAGIIVVLDRFPRPEDRRVSRRSLGNGRARIACRAGNPLFTSSFRVPNLVHC